MQITTVIVTRNKSASVKTLHSILKLNVLCMQTGTHNKILFVNDDYDSRRSMLKNSLKSCDRLIWIDYGVCIDEPSLRTAIARDWKWNGIVYPCVTEGIDWDAFKKNIDTPEPNHQKGLSFDTDVDKAVLGDFYSVKKTSPRCFCLDSKAFTKNIKKDKLSHNFRDIFDELLTTKFKLVAFTAAKLIATYPHECLGNILNAAGVKANKA